MLTWKVPAVLVATKEGPKLKDVFQESGRQYVSFSLKGYILLDKSLL